MQKSVTIRNTNHNKVKYVEIKCQLDATDDIYCRFYYFKAAACKPDTQPSAPHHTDNLKTKHQIPQAATTCIILSSS